MIDSDLQWLYNKLWVYFVDHHILGQPAVILLGGLVIMGLECVFRKWEDTGLYRLVVRRSVSAKVDIFSHLLQFLGLAFFLEIILTFGISLGAARLATYCADKLSWARIALPADNIPQIAFSFLVYYFTDHF